MEIIVKEKIKEMVAKMPSEVTNQDTYDQAITYGKQVSKMEKFIDTEEKKITRPLNESIKAARALFKPYREQCAEVKAQVKAILDTYRKEEDEKNRIQEERDLARLEKGTIREDTVTKKMVERDLGKTDTTGTTTSVLVIKSFDLSKVPVEYLLLNEAKVKAAYREGKEINGVELEYETRTRL